MDIESICKKTYNTITDCFDGVKDKSSKEAFKDSVETLFDSSMTYLTFSISLSYEDDEVIDRWKRKIRREAGEWYDDHIASKRKGSRYDDDDWDDDDDDY